MKYLKIASLSWIIPALAFSVAVSALQSDAKENFKRVSSKQVSDLLAYGSDSVHIFDANGDKTRKEFGIVPSATLLDSASKYDITKTLPSDKAEKLVFYCANEKCTASHTAAERAIEAGYTDVSVMTDGIKGWKDSGFTTEQYIS